MPQKIKAFVRQTPQKFYQRKLSRLPLVLVAIVAGAIGTYALVNSFAATPSCMLDLDHLTVSSGCPVTKSDTAASGDPATIDSLWGNIECADTSRLKFFTTGGDPHNTANGTPQGNTSYYEPTVLNGDDFYGSRCELGRNERRYGENGGNGTFQLYQQGQHKITFVSIRLPSNFQPNVQAWQTIMQMKQTEPDASAGNSPILEMQAYGNEFRIESDPAGELWTTSIVTGQWVRFAFDVTYSQNGDGKIKVYVDKNGDGNTLDPGEQSPVISTATLATETTPSLGDPPVLQTGNPVPGHLRLGLYHNPSYNCPAPTGCSTDDDNIQVVDLTGISTSVGTITPPDTTAPTVSLTAPSSGSTVSGASTTVSANASDDTGVAGVQFKLDGNNLGSEDTTAPYTTNWDTTTATNGSHTLTAVARDAAGNTKTSSSVNVTVANQTTSPPGNCTSVLGAFANLQTAINSLHAGDTLCLPPSASYTANEFDLRSVGGTASAPIVVTSQDPAHPATIYGRIVFFAGSNYTTLSWLNLNASNYNGTASTLTNGGDHNSFLHDDITNGHVAICLNDINTTDPSYGTAHYTLIDSNRIHDCGVLPAANHDHGIYESAFNTTITNNYIYDNADRGIQLRGAQNAVVEHNIVDGNGEGVIFGDLDTANNKVDHNIFSNSNVRFNVESILADTPADAGNTFTDNCVWSTVSGYYGSNQSIQPNLTGVGVSGVIFANPQYVDQAAHNYALEAGSPCEAQAPGSTSTTTTPPPPDTTAPTVSFASPANGATVSGIVTATANATDNTAVAKVDLSLDGSLKMTDTTAPYNYSFDSKTLTNGNHTLTAKAYDAAGNSSPPTTITIHVNNPDITPPSAPTGLDATATNPTTVHLSWDAASDTGANPTGVAKYNVLRNGVVIAQPTTTSYTDADATANTHYIYTVQAVDGAGNVSDDSGTATVTTPAAPDTTAPTVPTSLAATAISASQVNVTWDASTDTGGSGLAGYNIYRDGTKLNTTPITGTSYGDSTVNAANTYNYRVEAVDGAGNKSAQTSSVSATTPNNPDIIDPSTPANLVAKAVSTSQVNVTWDASTDTGGSGLAGYNIYRDGTKLNGTLITGRSYDDTSVDADTRYSYQVEAVDGAGNTSAKSSVVRVSTPRGPRTQRTGGGGGTSTTGSGSSQSSGSGSGTASGGGSNSTPSAPSSQHHTIAVRIFGAGHQPAKGASVAFSDQTATTDGNGVARFNDVAPGKQTVSVGYNGKETSKVINVKDVATQSEPELFDVATVRNVNPALLAIPVIVLLAAGGFFMRPWEKFARSPIDNSVADSVITSNRPAEMPSQPGRKLETPGAVYSPKEPKNDKSGHDQP